MSEKLISKSLSILENIQEAAAIPGTIVWKNAGFPGDDKVHKKAIDLLYKEGQVVSSQQKSGSSVSYAEKNIHYRLNGYDYYVTISADVNLIQANQKALDYLKQVSK